MTWTLVIVGWWMFNGIVALLMWRRAVLRERQECAQSRPLGRPAFHFPTVHGGKSSVMPAEHGRVVALRHGGHSA